MAFWHMNLKRIFRRTWEELVATAEIAKAFQEILPNNPECDELFKILGSAFDKNKWDSMKKETYLFKLSWKHTFPLKVKGNDTFYSKLLNGEL